MESITLIVPGSLIPIKSRLRIPAANSRRKVRHDSTFTFFVLHHFVFQIVNSHYQLSERTRPDGVLSVLEVSDCALGKSGLAG
jgi:hypothetical protein